MSPRANYVSATGKLDVQGLARTGESVVGIVRLADFKRVRDLLADDEGSLGFTVKGGVDERGRPVLAVKLEGSVTLNCQRCLLPFLFDIESETEILLAATEEELGVWDEEEGETVLAAAPMDLQELLEDELLLALPYAPRHPEGVCAPGAGSARTSDETRPFASLAAIKRKSTGNEN
ncbi:MAG: DUF177 domain-containing protein [Burkholderiales bacterium]|nr:MAG: DUF177 domain-containing protein [Burkholderiales bacterium]CAG1009107.1 Large ribosomal RNA subunit accumulation protein YceD [Myxococcaceae bacterium]